MTPEAASPALVAFAFAVKAIAGASWLYLAGALVQIARRVDLRGLVAIDVVFVALFAGGGLDHLLSLRGGVISAVGVLQIVNDSILAVVSLLASWLLWRLRPAIIASAAALRRRLEAERMMAAHPPAPAPSLGELMAKHPQGLPPRKDAP